MGAIRRFVEGVRFGKRARTSGLKPNTYSPGEDGYVAIPANTVYVDVANGADALSLAVEQAIRDGMSADNPFLFVCPPGILRTIPDGAIARGATFTFLDEHSFNDRYQQPDPHPLPYAGHRVCIIADDLTANLVDRTSFSELVIPEYGITATLSPLQFAQWFGVPIATAAPLNLDGDAGYGIDGGATFMSRIQFCKMVRRMFVQPCLHTNKHNNPPDDYAELIDNTIRCRNAFRNWIDPSLPLPGSQAYYTSQDLGLPKRPGLVRSGSWNRGWVWRADESNWLHQFMLHNFPWYCDGPHGFTQTPHGFDRMFGGDQIRTDFLKLQQLDCDVVLCLHNIKATQAEVASDPSLNLSSAAFAQLVRKLASWRDQGLVQIVSPEAFFGATVPNAVANPVPMKSQPGTGFLVSDFTQFASDAEFKTMLNVNDGMFFGTNNTSNVSWDADEKAIKVYSPDNSNKTSLQLRGPNIKPGVPAAVFVRCKSPDAAQFTVGTTWRPTGMEYGWGGALHQDVGNATSSSDGYAPEPVIPPSYDFYSIFPVTPGTSAVSGGTFKLRIGDHETSALAYNISNANLKTAIDALLDAAGLTGITCTVTGSGLPTNVTVITFNDVPADIEVPEIKLDSRGITGGGHLQLAPRGFIATGTYVPEFAGNYSYISIELRAATYPGTAYIQKVWVFSD